MIDLKGIVKRHGAVTALRGIDLQIRDGEFFALLGPSGSGKTTLLRILAGLESATEGRVFIDGADVTDVDPGERNVAMVFQSYALYPHMSVYENIAFPLRMVDAPDIDRSVKEAAQRVHIGHLLDRKPGQLSGGQQQRCALARAIVRKPRLFLLDEPLSNLDAKLRTETRVELRKLHRALGVTTVYVTHDQEEAMTIADRMAVFMDGRLEQAGTPDEVFARPRTLEVAAFLGNPPMNFFKARLRGRTAVVGSYSLELTEDYGERDAMLGVRPGAIAVTTAGIPARVELIEQLGEFSIVDFQAADTLVRARMESKIGLTEGAAVCLRFDPRDVHVFDAATRERL